MILYFNFTEKSQGKKGNKSEKKIKHCSQQTMI